jgi:glutathione synthase/RimK-type ligase-like ATP-grasp enzyme
MTAEILLWGLSGDVPTMSVLRALAERRVPHRFLDQRRPHCARFVASAEPCAGRLEIEGEALALEKIGAVYARPQEVPRSVQRTALTLNSQLYAWMEMTDAYVVNRPSAAWSNDSKPYQAERIRENGFAVPPTLVTTTPEAVREFVERHGEVVYKSTGRTRSRVTRLTAANLDDIDDVTHCPTQFQAYVPGVDWRVHVVGDEVHACEIRCMADDYRSAPEQGIALEVEAATLPEPIAARCRALARGLGLRLAGVDLRRRHDDTWYCFEVNPSPAFTWYERVTGQPLAAAVARLLIDACRSEVA